MNKPKWREIFPGKGKRVVKVEWCRGCGCLKIAKADGSIVYLTPEREKERRLADKVSKSIMTKPINFNGALF